MRNILKIILFLLLLATISQTHAQDYSGRVLVRSHSLSESDGTLTLTYDVWVLRNSVESYAALTLTPKLLTEHTSRTFPGIVIQGKNNAKTYERWLKTMSKKRRAKYQEPTTLVRVNNATDTILTYTHQLPYELWMDNAVLVFDQEIITYNNDRSLITFALDSKVKLSPRIPYEVQPYVNFIEPAFEQKMRKVQGQAFLDFPVGKSEILPNYRRNPEELTKIRTAFAKIENNDDVEIKSMFIEGYASPEGSYETNKRLSNARAEALKNYIVKNFNIPLSASQIATSSVAEDWEGLKELVLASDINEKTLIVDLIDSEQNLVRRKSKLQLFGGGRIYRTMLNEIYPQLRRVEYQIDFMVKDFTSEKAQDLIKRNPELLNQQELYRVANMYQKNSKEFEDILIGVTLRLFPDDPIANINAAAVMITRGEYVSASRLLEKHSNNPAAWNNIGVVALYEGELDAAEQWFNRALQNGVTEAQHNLEEVVKKRADNEQMKRFEDRY